MIEEEKEELTFEVKRRNTTTDILILNTNTIEEVKQPVKNKTTKKKTQRFLNNFVLSYVNQVHKNKMFTGIHYLYGIYI
jgi:hypothetical protein